MKEQKELIHNKVYEHRVLRRLSQTELAQAVGVSKQTIFVMEKGNYIPSLLLAFKLADFFGVTIDDLFTYENKGDN